MKYYNDNDYTCECCGNPWTYANYADWEETGCCPFCGEDIGEEAVYDR